VEADPLRFGGRRHERPELVEALRRPLLVPLAEGHVSLAGKAEDQHHPDLLAGRRAHVGPGLRPIAKFEGHLGDGERHPIAAAAEPLRRVLQTLGGDLQRVLGEAT